MKSVKQLLKRVSFFEKHREGAKKFHSKVYLCFMNLFYLPIYKFMFLIFGIDYICQLLFKTYSNKKALFLLSKFGAKIASDAQIYPPIIIDNAWVTGDFSNLTLEKNVYLGREVFLDMSGRIIIKENTAISGRVAIITHIDTGQTNLLSSYYPRKIEKVEVGCNSWIGFGATVISGITIGDFVVIGSGAVVNRNIPDYSLAVGVPAKVVMDIEDKIKEKN